MSHAIWNPKKPPGKLSNVVTYLSNTSMFQNYAIEVSMNLISSCIKLNIASVMCSLINYSFYVDFFVQILVTVMIHYAWTNTCIQFIYTNATFCNVDSCVRRIVSNMTEDKIEKIKRFSLFMFSSLAVCILHFIELSSAFLITYIIQNLIIVVLIDFIDKVNWSGLFGFVRKKIQSRYEFIDSQKAFNKKIESFEIHDSYIPKPKPKKKKMNSTRVINKKMRKFRLTRFMRYMYPKKV